MEDTQEVAVPRLTIHPRRAVKGVDDLWGELLHLASIVRQALASSVRTLASEPADLWDLAAEVEAAEDEINRREVQLEQDCLRVLALYEPVAIDLRRVATAFRVNGQLEHVGDLAVRIARRARKPRTVQIPPDLFTLATMVQGQFDEAVALLADPGSERARSIIISDLDVARCHRRVRGEMKRRLQVEPGRITEWLRLLNTARNLENIGDHAASIAEALIFVKDGSTSRHERRRLRQA